MYYFTPDTIAEANEKITSIDPKIGGLLCILSCLNGEIEENSNYTINGPLLRKKLSTVFDKTPKQNFDNAKSSYIIFAKDWGTTFFNHYIKNKIDLTACAVFFLRRNGFEREYEEDEVIETFVKRFNLEPYVDQWFLRKKSIKLEYNQLDVEGNQIKFYSKMNYNNEFKSILFKGVIQKSAADLKAAGQIQTLYSGSGVQTCFLLSDEPLDKYYIMSNSSNSDNEDSINDTLVSGDGYLMIRYNTGYQSKFARNKIIFGAPGTGKSYTINKERESLIGQNNETDYERVTFHPDYSYANFVGTYKPVPGVKDENGTETITYKYVPGPFMRVLVKALRNAQTDDPKPFLLIIEEINRANVAAVFGDVFQLLDRNENNVSEYPIQVSEDMKKYLSEELNVDPEECSKIRIPDNMFIWATMNSADQGVYPMDTAFKRRWAFTYLGIDDCDNEIRGKYVVVGSKEQQRIEWNELRKAINEFLAVEKINEDKQLGPYFLSRNIVVPSDGSNEINSEKFCDAFKHKVLMYLFEDAGKQKRQSLFEGSKKGYNRYSKICEAFDEQGIGIFSSTIQTNVTVQDLKINEYELDGNGIPKSE